VVLTGVNIGRYEDAGHVLMISWKRYWPCQGISGAHLFHRTRWFGDKLISFVTHPKLAPHMHLCLQSGSDRILLQMRRMYTIQRFREIVSKVKAVVPDFNFTNRYHHRFSG
jgi:threonylcarbamoyladenosine tRNA methylthiotransferase MtaB